jgi:hypothetical protein
MNNLRESGLRVGIHQSASLSNGQHTDLKWPYDSYRQLYLDWHIIQKAGGMTEGHHQDPQNCRSSCASGLIAAVVVKGFLRHGTGTTT